MLQINSLADFKKALKVGVEVETEHAKIGSFGIRKISIVQTNSFALSTTKKNGEIVDSWCQYPKAKDIECNGTNTVKIFWGEGDRRELILTYTIL